MMQRLCMRLDEPWRESKFGSDWESAWSRPGPPFGFTHAGYLGSVSTPRPLGNNLST